MTMTHFIEQACDFTHEGKTFSAGGAVVTPDYLIAYPGKDGVLHDWHGNAIGRWASVSSWRVNSYMGERMHQIEATVDGTRYTGRGFGVGMIYKGRTKRS
jgi:hypothetical protein